METLRRLLAFPMFATVAWLVWVLGQQSGIDGAGSLLGLLVTAACLRFFLISDKSTFVDEVLHITWAKGYEVSGFHGVKAKDLGITQEPGNVAQAPVLWPAGYGGS